MPTALVLTLLAAAPSLRHALLLYHDLDEAGAERELRALLATDPPPHTGAVAHIYLGMISMELEFDSQGAEAEFRRAVALEPTVDLPLSAAPKERMIFVRAQRAEIDSEIAPRADARTSRTAPLPPSELSSVPSAAIRPEAATSHHLAQATWWLGGSGAAAIAAGTVLGFVARGNGNTDTGVNHSVAGQSYVTGQYEGLTADIAWSVGGALLVSAVIVAFTSH
jgi:hypothetical protein